MSKKWLIIPAAILAAGVGATGVLANARGAEKPAATVNLSETLNGNIRVDKAQGDFVNASENPNGGFVDNDNDGICDNYANGTGKGCGRGNGGFVDSDNDGICDNYTNGTGKGCGRGNGGFADSDNDGICDNYTNGAGKGCGRGNGHHSGGRANGCHHGGSVV